MQLHPYLVLTGFVFQAIAFAQTPSSVSLMASPSPAAYGHPVLLTATASSGATGKVTFYDGVTILGTGTLSAGQASLSTVLLPAGNRNLRAYYQGDGTYTSSSSTPLPLTVLAGPSLGLQAPIAYPGPQVVDGVAVGDLNGDGKQDLVLANEVDNTLQVLLGKGDGSFQAAVSYPVGRAPEYIAIADFNGDGAADIAVLNANDGFVSILIGNGDGTYQPAVNLPLIPAASGLVAADVNGDGKADLLIGNYYFNTITVLLGNGDGTFGPPSTVAASGPIRPLAIGDFNGDGVVDLAVLLSNGVGTMQGNGDGTFQAVQSIAVSGTFVSVAVADFNGDGIQDLLVDTQSSSVYVLLGKGNGTFAAPVASSKGQSYGRVAFGDFNGDGILDLALSASVAIALGNGDGTFGTPVTYGNNGNGQALVVADFNGDGKTDIATYGQPAAADTIVLGGAVPDMTVSFSHGFGIDQGQQGAAYAITVSNTGTWPTVAPVAMVANLPSAASPTSIGGSGWTCVPATLTCVRTDSIANGASYPVINLTFNVSNGASGNVTAAFTVSGGGETNSANDTATDTTFLRYPSTTTLSVAPTALALSQPITLTATVTSGATGAVDFYAGSVQLGSAAINGGTAVFTTTQLPPGVNTLRAIYPGDSHFAPSASVAQTATVSEPPWNGFSPYISTTLPNYAFVFATADFNGDGKPDLVTGGDVMLGNGDGTFRHSATLTAPYSTPSIGDFNNDGKMDVLIRTAQGIYLFLGNGDGTFQSGQMVNAASSGTIAIGDFNSDGRPDIVLCSTTLLLLLGNGDGTFQPPATISAAFNSNYGPIFLQAADMNGDGKADLVLVESGINILIGNGDGTFHSPINYASTGLAFAIADFNRDGKLDIAAVPETAGTVLILPGNGDGTLGAPISSGISFWTGGFALAADLNGDGKLDLVVTSYYSSGVMLLFGNGDGTFQSGLQLPTDYCSNCGEAQISAVAADFNGDGREDLAVLVYSASKVDTYLAGQFSGLLVSSAHAGRFTAGSTGTYQITVGNGAFASSSGTVTVTDTLPPGFTPTAASGTGWTCTLSPLKCTRSDVLTSGSTYPVITITVNLASNLPASTVTNNVSVTMGAVQNSAGDSTIVVLPSTVSVTASPSPSTLGQLVTLTAAVTPGTTGSVLFVDAGVPLGAGPIVNGVAIIATRLLPSGYQSIWANYPGDVNYAPSIAPAVYQTVNASSATWFSTAATYRTGAGPVSIAAADFNHDGHTDLVTANSTANTVTVLLGSGNGAFGPSADYAVGRSPLSVVVADFNNDGFPDLATANYPGNNVSVLLGKGDGTFLPATTLPVNNTSQGIMAGDFNVDGKVDLVVVGPFTGVYGDPYGGVTVLLGNGDGTFTTVSGSAIPVTGTAFGTVADFNQDGKVDIAAATGEVLLGNGDGTFQYTNRELFTASGNVLLVGDLNADGKSDVISPNYYGVNVLLGNGDGTLQAQQNYPLTRAPSSGTLADIDGDGKLDVVTLDQTSNGLNVFFGNGDGTLKAALFSAVGTGPTSVVAGDFNGDGRTDLAIANYPNGGVTILLGTVSGKLYVTSSHSDPFAIGQANAAYTLTVSNIGAVAMSTTVTLTDTLPYGTQATAIQGSGWNCTLSPLACTNNNPLPAGQSYAPITLAVKVLAPYNSVSNTVTVSGGGSPNATASDPTTIVNPPITIQTSPTGLQFTIGTGAAQTASQTVNLATGSYRLAVSSPQTGSAGTRYTFLAWSDSGAASHTINVSGPANYTAAFQTQYQLTTALNPPSGGSLDATSGTYYNAGSIVTVTATANSPLVFTGWSNGANSNPLQLTMNAPVNLTAYFDIPGATCMITGQATAGISDVQYIIDEALGVAPPNSDLNADGVVNIADVQKVANAAMDLGCIH